MAIIRIKNIKQHNILDSKIIINPVSIYGNRVNELNKILYKEYKQQYKLVGETTTINKIRGKNKKADYLLNLKLKPITPTSFNIITVYKTELKFIVNIPYYKKREEKSYLETLNKMFNDAREYPTISIAIPLFGKCFGKLKKDVMNIILSSGYPAYIDIYVDNENEELISKILVESKNGDIQKNIRSGD